LEIHCPQKSTNYNTLLIIDQFYTSQLGLTEANYVPSICLQDGCASIAFGASSRGTLTVYSISGSKMTSQKVMEVSNAQIPVSSWSSGVYFLHYTLSSGAQGVVRFVKE
jgi:hypothetical protein